MRLGALVLILALFAGFPAAGQYLRHMNAHPMLRASGVYHVAGDSRGFLWFCTDHGLVRYDGHASTYFTRQQGLADDMIFNMYEDRKGRIWAFAYNGKYSFVEGDSIHNQRNDPWLASIPHTDGYVTSMAEAADGSLYFGFISRNILCFRPDGTSILQRHPPDRGSVIVEDKILRHINSPAIHILASDRIHRLATDDEGLKVFHNDSVIWRMDDPALTYRTVFDLYLTPDRELLVSTISGLEIISLRTRRRTKILHDIRISSCHPDAAGNFWISTISNGVYLLHQEGAGIRQLHGFDGLDWTVISDGSLVFTKDHRLYKLVPSADSLLATPVAADIPNYFTPLYASGGRSIYFDSWQKLSFLVSGSLEQQRLRRIIMRGPDDELFFKKVYAARGQELFMYGGYEIYHYRRSADSFQFVATKRFPGKIEATTQDPRDGTIYFSTQGVLYRYDFDHDQAVPVHTSGVFNGASALSVTAAGLLVLSEDRRLHLLSPVSASGRLRPLNLGFAMRGMTVLNPSVMLLFAEGVDYLWNVNVPGRPAEPLQYPFSSAEYERIAFSGSKCLMKIDGKTYYFDTALLNRRRAAAGVYLRRLTINGRDYKTNDIEIRNTARLNLQVSLGMLDFSNTQQAIRYRLQGLEDSSWQLTRATELTFVLRKAGAYELQVAPEHAGAGDALSIRIRVHTPFFRSATFIALCAFLVLALCALGFVLVLRYRRRHFLRELEYLRLEHRAINALLNPHFIFNSINNIQGLIHRAEKNDAAEYLAVLSRLIRQNLENLQFNLIPLRNELALIERYIRLQNLRFGGVLHLHIGLADDALSEVQIPPLIVHTFVENAIIHGFRKKDQPFHVHISVRMLDADYLEIIIRDNGVGLRAAAAEPLRQPEKSSMGISFNQKRLGRLSEFYKLRQEISLHDLSGAGGQGTEVRIVLFAALKTLLERRPQPAH